jgi:hypothetical protein
VEEINTAIAETGESLTWQNREPKPEFRAPNSSDSNGGRLLPPAEIASGSVTYRDERGGELTFRVALEGRVHLRATRPNGSQAKGGNEMVEAIDGAFWNRWLLHFLEANPPGKAR